MKAALLMAKSKGSGSTTGRTARLMKDGTPTTRKKVTGSSSQKTGKGSRGSGSMANEKDGGFSSLEARSTLESGTTTCPSLPKRYDNQIVYMHIFIECQS